jgi:hypothetical protein
MVGGDRDSDADGCLHPDSVEEERLMQCNADPGGDVFSAGPVGLNRTEIARGCG